MRKRKAPVGEEKKRGAGEREREEDESAKGKPGSAR